MSSKIDLPTAEELAETLTSTHWVWKFRPGDVYPATLLECLRENLTHIPEASWESRFEYGGVFVNGYAALGDCALTPPTWIEYYEPKLPPEEARAFFARFDPSYIVYEDEQLAVVFKPSRLPSLPSREQRHFSMKRYLEDHFGHPVHLPSRLDLSTSGLMAISKSPDSHRALQQAFERRLVEKRYLVQVRGTPEWTEKTVDAPIARSTSHPVLREVAPHGLPAVTEFTVLARNGENTVIEARPLTGRTHQIRVHARHLGFPLLGDRFYGGPAAAELNLLSFAVGLPHPATGAPFFVSLPERLFPNWLKSVGPAALISLREQR